MKFTFAHTFEANWEVEADSPEEAERMIYEKFYGKFKMVNRETGEESFDFPEQEPWEIERDGIFG